jgi:VanZ family protein
VKKLFSSDGRARFLTYAPVVIWLGVIFFLSSDNGSMSETSRFIRPLLVFLFPSAPEETIRLYHAYVRKAAHFTEYAVLAVLVTRLFLSVNSEALKRWWPLLVVTIVAMVACLDELNQSYEASRTSSPYDVMLDILGGACAVGVVWLVRRRRGRN